ncbi:hypothetical protein MXB_3327 [Myxobolus squamalis]|nr:hypothetical protein MXB_3327 [Myxobolus squamalis]
MLPVTNLLMRMILTLSQSLQYLRKNNQSAVIFFLDRVLLIHLTKILMNNQIKRLMT